MVELFGSVWSRYLTHHQTLPWDSQARGDHVFGAQNRLASAHEPERDDVSHLPRPTTGSGNASGYDPPLVGRSRGTRPAIDDQPPASDLDRCSAADPEHPGGVHAQVAAAQPPDDERAARQLRPHVPDADRRVEGAVRHQFHEGGRAEHRDGQVELARRSSTSTFDSHEPMPVQRWPIPADPYTRCCICARLAASATFRPCRVLRRRVR